MSIFPEVLVTGRRMNRPLCNKGQGKGKKREKEREKDDDRRLGTIKLEEERRKRRKREAKKIVSSTILGMKRRVLPIHKRASGFLSENRKCRLAVGNIREKREGNEIEEASKGRETRETRERERERERKGEEFYDQACS